MKFLHSMIRVSDPAATVAFFQLLGLEERRRTDNEAGRFTLIFRRTQGGWRVVHDHTSSG